MKTITLDNGLKVLLEERKGTQTVSMHLGVRAGVLQEPDHLSGISHFLEHMVFRGTSTMSGEELSEAVEGNGGSFNAFTEHEYTEYYVTMLARNWEIGFQILMDVVTNPTLGASYIEMERDIILDEIVKGIDDVEACAWDRFNSLVWKPLPVSRPILGTRESVMNMKRDDLVDYYSSLYVAENLCFAAVGNFHEARMMEKLEKCKFNRGLKPLQNDNPFSHPVPENEYRKDCQQANVVWGHDISPVSMKHPDRFALSLLSIVVGGNSSSHLFQEVRDRRGLAYSISADVSFIDKNGWFAISVASDLSKLPEIERIAAEEMERCRIAELHPREVENAKNYLVGIFANALETNYSTGRRLCLHGLFGMDPSVEAFIKGVDEVTPAHIKECVNRYIDPQRLVKVAILPES